MQENQNAQSETAQEDQVLILDDKQYKVSDLSDESKLHLANLRVVESQINHYDTTVSCLKITQNTMMGGMRETLKDIPFTKVEKPQNETPATTEVSEE